MRNFFFWTRAKAKPDLPPPCLNPAHEPPRHMVYPPGPYTHTCPGCGRSITIYNTRPIW